MLYNFQTVLMAVEDALQADTVSSADTAEVLELLRLWH